MEWVALGGGLVWWLWFNVAMQILSQRGRRRALADYMHEDVIDWDMRGQRPLPADDIRLKQSVYWSTVAMLGVFGMLFLSLVAGGA